MIEVIALILLTAKMGRIASRKGLKPGRWQLYTILAWLAGEFAGILVGIMIFGTNNLVSVILVALAGAITGYLILKSNLSKRPDLNSGIN